MSRPKRSPIWKLPSDDFKILLYKSKTYKEVLDFFGLGIHGNNYKTIKQRCIDEKINLDHFKEFTKFSKIRKSKPLSEVQTENSSYSRHHLKDRLLKEGLLEIKCAICGLNNEWNGKPISLVLDHENGVPNDHRMENLRLVCPNCNSQLDTFAGKHKRPKERVNCKNCGRVLAKRSKKDICVTCSMFNLRKIDWPSLEELQKEIAQRTDVRWQKD